MKTWKYRVRFHTPAFLGDADQNGRGCGMKGVFLREAPDRGPVPGSDSRFNVMGRLRGTGDCQLTEDLAAIELPDFFESPGVFPVGECGGTWFGLRSNFSVNPDG